MRGRAPGNRGPFFASARPAFEALLRGVPCSGQCCLNAVFNPLDRIALRPLGPALPRHRQADPPIGIVAWTMPGHAAILQALGQQTCRAASQAGPDERFVAGAAAACVPVQAPAGRLRAGLQAAYARGLGRTVAVVAPATPLPPAPLAVRVFNAQCCGARQPQRRCALPGRRLDDGKEPWL
jgi:hypothetical protein